MNFPWRRSLATFSTAWASAFWAGREKHGMLLSTLGAQTRGQETLEGVPNRGTSELEMVSHPTAGTKDLTTASRLLVINSGEDQRAFKCSACGQSLANPPEWPQAFGHFSLSLYLPMAMWTDSTGWATVSAQICRLCRASTPSTDSRRFFTVVKSTPLGVPGDIKHNAEGYCSPTPNLTPFLQGRLLRRPPRPAGSVVAVPHSVLLPGRVPGMI